MIKSIKYNPYARKRMFERGVAEKDIEYALEHRHVTMPGKRKGRIRIFSWISNRCLNLVIKERPKDIWVISVAWRGE